MLLLTIIGLVLCLWWLFAAIAYHRQFKAATLLHAEMVQQLHLSRIRSAEDMLSEYLQIQSSSIAKPKEPESRRASAPPGRFRSHENVTHAT
jgi:hypothetical protein